MITFQDIGSVVDKVCDFLSLEYSVGDKGRLLDQLSVEKMKTNEAVNDTALMVKLGQFKANEGSFIRKGKTGGWKDYFDDEAYAKMEAWKEANSKLYELPLDKLWK